MDVVKQVFSYRKIGTETAFKRFLVFIAIAMMVLAIAIFLTLIIHSIPSFKSLGAGFF